MKLFYIFAAFLLVTSCADDTPAELTKEEIASRLKSTFYGEVEGCKIYIVNTGLKYNDKHNGQYISVPSRMFWLTKCPANSSADWTEQSGKYYYPKSNQTVKE